MHREWSVILLFAVGLGCSGCGFGASAAGTATAQTAEALAFQALADTATALAAVTDTPPPTETPTLRPPTATPPPPWCRHSPVSYLNAVERLSQGREDAIVFWNSSARRQSELLQTEVMLREVIVEAEALQPPEDFLEMHSHFLAYLEASLATLFGITDENEDHRQGGNITMQEEWDLTTQAWDRALALRDRQCP